MTAAPNMGAVITAVDAYAEQLVAAERQRGVEELQRVQAEHEEAWARLEAEHRQAIESLTAQRDQAIDERDEAVRIHGDHMTTVHPAPPPPPAPEPEPKRRVLIGMAAYDHDLRLRETGPVDALRIFVSGWDVAALIRKIEEAHRRGVTPYWSMKFQTTWAAAAGGADDDLFDELGRALGVLGYRTYGSFHHEPRDSSIKTPTALVPWSRANIRAIGIVKPLAGPLHKLGTTDNGFPWGERAKNQRLTDAELAVYYTRPLLEVVDFLGGDFYDGKTDTNPGEPAAVKMANFERWAARVAPGKPLTVGEFNAVTAADIRAAWDVLKDGPWEIACLFNSARNNRADLPTDGSLGVPPSWVLRGERLAAFKAVLAASRT